MCCDRADKLSDNAETHPPHGQWSVNGVVVVIVAVAVNTISIPVTGTS